MIFRITTLSLAALGLPLGACATVPDDGMGPPAGDNELCDADDAQGVIGEQASSATGQRILDLTGARMLRWGPPGAVFTMDFRPDRVNVMYDGRLSITQISCG